MVSPEALGTGIVNGFALALVSLGFALVFRATGVVNFANGVQMVLGGYVGWLLGTEHGLPFVAAAACAVAAGVISGVFLDRVALAPLRRASLLAQVIVLLAASQVASTLFLSIFGPNPKAMRAYASKSPIVSGLNWSGMDVILIGVTIGLVVLLALALNGTDIGLRIRATASNPTGAAILGINPVVVSTLAWGVGGGLAALSGVLVFPTYLLTPDIGQHYTFDSFAAVVLGGFGSFPGAIVGGLILGVIQAGVADAFSASYSPFVSLGVMLIVLLAKPNGLLGARA
ncbi:MAG TPA: branched-chain amino acid ABC transporter permease [Thermoleophilaceae bacterium]|jgi:branched-chain amino acid transport system permease protein|nr:branched-chain amino acid ABC transporter permease [Thermoleophilaceae bacterium]